MRDGEPNVYAGLATLRNGYMQAQWQRVGLFILINATALPIVLGSSQSGDLKRTVCYVVVIAYGLILTGTLRAEMWVREIDERLSTLEKLDANEVNAVRIAFFSDPAFTSKRRSIFATRKVFLVIWFLSASFWAQETYTRTAPYLPQFLQPTPDSGDKR